MRHQEGRCRILCWPPVPSTSTASSLRRPSFASKRVIRSFSWGACTSAASSCSRPDKFAPCAISRENESRSRRLGSPQHVFLASIAAYVGLDPSRDINFVTYPANQSMQLLADSKIDALLSFPPVPQELRAKMVGHVILNSSVDRPWSQYFCCMISANREFVRNHPAATKRAMRALLKAVDLCVAKP